MTVYIGIDVSKEKLDCVWGSPKGEHSKQFSNKPRGIDSLHHWGVSRAPGEETVFVVESTGPYHQLAVSILDGLGVPVIVGNPNQPKAYAEGIGQKQKTDRTDAATIGKWAKACTPRRWKPTSLPMQELRALTIRLLALTDHERRERLRLKENPRVLSWISVARSIQRMLKLIAEEKAALLDEIDAFYAAHPVLHADRKLLQTIPGVGPQAADHLMCLIRDRGLTGRQAAALAGVTPVHRQSGKTLNAKSRISRGGDRRVRAGLFMPALSAIQNNPRLKAFYERLIAAGVRKIGAVVAVIRKIITIASAMLDKQQPFDLAHGMETAPDQVLALHSLAAVA